MHSFSVKARIKARIALENAGWRYVCTLGGEKGEPRLYFVKVEPLTKFVLDKNTIGTHSFQRAIGLLDN